MKILIAPDSFKGSLSAMEVCNNIEIGISKVTNDIDIIKVPMADGGEGTLERLRANMEFLVIGILVLLKWQKYQDCPFLRKKKEIQ